MQSRNRKMLKTPPITVNKGFGDRTDWQTVIFFRLGLMKGLPLLIAASNPLTDVWLYQASNCDCDREGRWGGTKRPKYCVSTSIGMLMYCALLRPFSPRPGREGSSQIVGF